MFSTFLIDAAYFVAAFLFLYGLKRMASPVTARSGIVVAGGGMVLAVAAAFLYGFDVSARAEPYLTTNVILLVIALGLGIGWAWISGKRVAMTDMPQMVALYNGMGGGAAAAIAATELLSGNALAHGPVVTVLAILGGLIGAVALSGSLIAWAKLDGRMNKAWRLPKHQYVNAALLCGALFIGAVVTVMAVVGAEETPILLILVFFAVALALGVLLTTPIGGADMPVVISLYNAFTGLAVSFEGYVLGNEALIIAGMMVGAAGILLTRLMAKAMNRPIRNVLFSNFGGGAGGEGQAISGSQKPIEAADVAAMMAFAERVVIVPGYGMAVAQAQHKIWELAQRLGQRGVKVKFAIHPVAGRMPGHMNVLLAEAGVPYDLIADMDDINPEFANTDVVLVIGANDVVNPVARTDPASPIYGMPVLDVVNARNVVVIKRGKGTGFAGIENALFYADNTRMLYGDGAEAAASLVSELKALDGGH